MKKLILLACLCANCALTQAQNIGIGTTSPATKLDVNGKVNSAGYYMGGASAPINIELIRSLPNTINNTVEIGNLSLTNGAHDVRLSVSISNGGFSETQVYSIPIAYNGTGGVWQELIPSSTTGAYSGNDFATDIMVSLNVATFRLRRTLGAADGSTSGGTGATVRLESVGSSTDVFTATTTTASTTAPTAFYANTTAIIPNYIGIIPALIKNADFRGITISASSEYSVAYQAWESMSGAAADWATAGVTTNFWIQVQFPTKTPINKVAMRGRASNEVPTAELIQGSNDGSTWTTLGSFSTTLTYSLGNILFSVNNANFYYYRITFATSTGGVNPGLNFLQFYRF